MSDEDLKKQIAELKDEQDRLKKLIGEPVKFPKRTSISSSGEFKEIIRELNIDGVSEEKFLRKQIEKIENIKIVLLRDGDSEKKLEEIKKIVEE